MAVDEQVSMAYGAVSDVMLIKYKSFFIISIAVQFQIMDIAGNKSDALHNFNPIYFSGHESFLNLLPILVKLPATVNGWL